jgi:hypothetical protein
MVAAGSAHLPNAVATPRPYPQGTTCVYSKKVEYLHNLVFRALETIHNKKQRERGGTDEEGGAKRGTRQVRLLLAGEPTLCVCVCWRLPHSLPHLKLHLGWGPCLSDT